VNKTGSTIVENSRPTFDRAPLPDGWRWVRLEEICEFAYGSGLPSHTRQEGTVPVYGSNGIVGYHDEALTEGEAIIIGRKGSIGEVHFSSVPCFPIDTTYFIERTNSDADLTWLAFWLRALNLRELNKAAAVPGLNREDVYSLEIPYPPLSEQRRIAAILNKQMAAIERARAAAEAQLKAAKELPAAYLREVFESPEAEQWEKKRIGDVAKVQSGYAFKSDWFTPGGIRLLRNANIFQGFISWADTVCLSMSRRAEFEAYELGEGDIVLSLDRPLVSNGLKVARLSSNDIPALLLQRVGRFQLRGGIDADYLYAFLNSEKFIKAITTHDQSLGVPHVSPAQVEAVEIPLPSLTEQQQIAQKLTKQIQTREQINNLLKDQLDSINKLPAALLRQAFAGKL
jgi:type I restriction enzyme, S subunit